jgi:hypothetical protein
VYCPKCGYNLFGLAEQRCPECGTAFDPESLRKNLPPYTEVGGLLLRVLAMPGAFCGSMPLAAMAGGLGGPGVAASLLVAMLGLGVALGGIWTSIDVARRMRDNAVGRALLEGRPVPSVAVGLIAFVLYVVQILLTVGGGCACAMGSFALLA